MPTTPNFDLLRKAVGVIDAAPEKRFNLKQICDLETWRTETAHCGTTACAVGWIALSGQFGNIHLHNSGNSIDKAFSLNNGQWICLFGTRYGSEYDQTAPAELTDKQLWLHRVQCFFTEHGEVL